MNKPNHLKSNYIWKAKRHAQAIVSAAPRTEETREMGGKIHHSTTDDKTYHEAECNVLSW